MDKTRGAGQRKTMTFPERLKVLAVLTQYCRAENGVSNYAPGYDDTRVATLAEGQHGFTVKPGAVATMRKEVFGPEPRSGGGMAVRVSALEARIAVLEDLIHD